MVGDSEVKEGKQRSLPSQLGQDNGVQLARGKRSRLGQLGRAVLLLCVVAQTATLLPGLLKRVKEYSSNVENPSQSVTNSADEWKDDIWPIREPTPWDISTDFPYPRHISFDTEEGTWLRLDVHPTSGEIIFDMLGDIYCLPASSYLASSSSGFTWARAVTGGVPHDSDPHFSPDGRQIVFRSDAELGVENIWVTDWASCEDMDVRPATSDVAAGKAKLMEALAVMEDEDRMLASGIKEDSERKRRRLLREGRLSAWRITNETYRWVSDARFHPSGTKVIATKWYTSGRSLGAGEGWEYPLPSKGEQISVGSGRRVVGRQLAAGWDPEDYGDQQIGPEQFIWAGNDSLIFAKNVRDVDGTFQYSKDVHSGIYAIFSHNVTTGGTSTLVPPAPGGASRPELSRDGRTLAFVRRVRDKEALVLKDLQSGTLHNIWYGLTFDLGVISAPMGTYPSFSFTPNDDAIIIWTGGKIWRVPLGINGLGEKVVFGEPHIIPFKARIHKKLAKTRDDTTDLLALETADTQRLHAFVDLAVDDDGKRVVFQGAGLSYYIDFDPSSTAKAKSGKKVPVLHPDQAYHSPSFVPGNSNLIIHSRWSDRNFSTFEIADLASGKAFELSGLPLGRYIHPVLCTCSGRNRRIAFLKMGGDLLSGSVIATANPGLYIGEITLPDSPFDASESVSIKNVQFVSSQIYIGDRTTLKFLDGNKRLLVQQSSRAFVINLASGPDPFGNYDHTTVAEGLMSAEIAVPVAADYIAFIDFFNVFVVKSKNAGGEPVWSKPGSATKGLARVGLDGGHDLQWDGTGKRLFWLLGPYLHSLDVSKLSKCSSSIKKDVNRFGVDCIKDLLDIQEIDVSYPTDVFRLSDEALSEARAHSLDVENADVFAITNATLITMASGQLSDDYIEDGVIIVRKGVIESVTVSRHAAIPRGASVFNAHGGFIVPGFIDVHAHWGGFGNAFPAKSWELQTFLAYGVTTLHNPSSDNVLGFVERARVESGGMIGPRIFHTGDVIYGAGYAQIHNDVADPTDAHSALIRIKAEGGPASFSYKNYNQYSRASRQRLLLAAANLSMLCVPEGGMNQDWDVTYFIDGMTTIEHAMPIPVLYDDVITAFAYSGTGITPTHIVNYGGVMGEQYVWAHLDVPNDPKLRRFTKHDILESLSETTHRPKDSFALFNTSASVAKMVQKGLRAHIGAHGEPPLGEIYHAEMYFTQQGGLSNFEVLRAATIDAAKTLGIHGAVGSLAKGRLADFLIYAPGIDVLDGDIRETGKIDFVVRGGRMWNATTMEEQWPKKGRKALMPIINAD